MMTVMYSFCLWFPVRLGAVIVGISTALQSLACLIACGIGTSDLENTEEVIADWLNHNDMLVTTGFFSSMRDEPSKFFAGFISSLTIHLVTCLLLILGAFRCTIWMIYPFVGLDFLRLIVLSVVLIISLLIVKANTLTLGVVIGCSIVGGFLLLYLWYQWFCVVSLCQIISEVGKMEEVNRTALFQVHPSIISKADVPGRSSYIPKHSYYGLNWN